MIDESDVFIGFFTRRHPIYQVCSNLSGAWQVLRGIKPELWSAPPWVLQESGYALRRMGRERLILLREPDVEIPGLQGDLEYVPFVPERAAEVFSKLNDMIHGLLAEAAGTEVKMVVTQRLEEAPSAVEPSTPETQSATTEVEPKEPDILESYYEMASARDNQDFDGLENA